MRLSIVIPAYNAAELIPSTVNSILGQSFTDYEIIIVDDGSTDDTLRVCQELAGRSGNIRVISKENGGVSSARNAGIEAAKGEYLMFVDADDLLVDGALKTICHDDYDFILAGFEKVVSDVVTESHVPAAERSYVMREEICDFFDDILPENNTYILNSACFKLFRRSVLLENGIRFIDGLSFAEDKMFVLSFLLHAEKIKTVPSVAYRYMIRRHSLSSDMYSDRHVDNILLLLNSYYPVLRGLEARFSGSRRIMDLYHSDLVGRYVCRVLDILATRCSRHLTRDNISTLYRYMDEDRNFGVLNLRVGQIPNMLLYAVGNPGLTIKTYRLTSALAGLFRRS